MTMMSNFDGAQPEPDSGNSGLREALCEIAGDDNLLFMEGFDQCILGIAMTHGSVPRVSYSVELILETLENRDGMSHDEALEYYEHNIGCSYAGPYTPALVIAAPGVDISSDNDEEEKE